MRRGAVYNEIDPWCAELLRRLIAAGELPPGDVDERSIADVQPDDYAGYRQVHLFAGIGGWPLAARLAGWPDDRDLWTGSPPCQPFSCAGEQRGMADERHLWPHAYRLVAALAPDVLFGEQVPAAIGKGWLDRVFDDLEAEGYACRAFGIPASSVGAAHRRDRLWFVADAQRDEQSRPQSRRWPDGRVGRVEQSVAWDTACERALPVFRAMDDGLPRCVAATDAARNAIVPAVAAQVIAAWMDACDLFAGSASSQSR